MLHPDFRHGTTRHAGSTNSPDTATDVSMHPAKGLLGDAPHATGLFLVASLDTGPPRLSPAVFDSLSGHDGSHNAAADPDRLEADAGPLLMMSQRAGHNGSSVELPLRQSDFSR